MNESGEYRMRCGDMALSEAGYPNSLRVSSGELLVSGRVPARTVVRATALVAMHIGAPQSVTCEPCRSKGRAVKYGTCGGITPADALRDRLCLLHPREES